MKYTCVTTVHVWLQELGTSGVTRFKAKFERRGPYDPGFAGLAYETHGYVWSLPFPDDSLSYGVGFTAVFRYPMYGRYKIRAILVGIREGWWRWDRKIKVNLPGDAGCPTIPTGA